MNEQNNATASLLSELYKNMKMGADGIINLSSKVGEGALRDELARQLDTYESFSKKIEMQLYELGDKPMEENPLSKFASKVGIAMNTLADSSESHIAQMMIEGATMGVTENTKLLNRYEKKDVSPRAITLCRESIEFMEKSIEELKKFL